MIIIYPTYNTCPVWRTWSLGGVFSIAFSFPRSFWFTSQSCAKFNVWCLTVVGHLLRTLYASSRQARCPNSAHHGHRYNHGTDSQRRWWFGAEFSLLHLTTSATRIQHLASSAMSCLLLDCVELSPANHLCVDRRTGIRVTHLIMLPCLWQKINSIHRCQ